MNIEKLTKNVIAIPSYLDESTNEKNIGDYIVNYLKKRTQLIVEKEIVEGERYNIIAYSSNCKKSDSKFTVDTLFINHIDTVEPKQGGIYDQFAGIEKNGNLYGLGSVDTKGNVAVLMKLAEIITNKKCMFLFYIDEEYDFKGIKTFIKDYKNVLQVKKIISADGENLQIRNASRGLIELDITCIGKTGHSSNPTNGVNVIDSFFNIYSQLRISIEQLADINLGKTSINLAYIHAGLNRGKKTNTVVLGREGNNIPDYLEATLEFRTNSKIDLKYIQAELKKLAKAGGIVISKINVRHNLKPWSTPKNKLNFITDALNINQVNPSYTNAGITGYVDIALLNKTFSSICCCIGDKGKNRHGVNEYVEIDSLYKLFNIFKNLIHTPLTSNCKNTVSPVGCEAD